MKLKILKFINENDDWEKILTSSPYNLTIKRKGEYILIKYSQIFSDFTEPMVREARGLIIKRVGHKYKVVCMPFTKFFNVGDPNAKSDIKKLCHRKKWYVEEKIDGSLTKAFYDDGSWHIATNGTPCAFDAPLQFPMNGLNNYGDLFGYASKGKIDYDKLDKQYTYMFELVGLENKVIVPYTTEDVCYLGKRNNYTLIETPYFKDDCIGVERCKRPKCWIVDIKGSPKKALEELKQQVNSLTKECENFEGYVVSDESLKTRIKMKSNQYMELSSQKGEGVFSPKKILLMILDQKDDDLLSLFPEYKPQFDTVRNLFCVWLEKVKDDLRYMSSHSWEDQKSFAEWAKGTTCQSITFSAYKSKEDWSGEWLEGQIKNMQISSLLKHLGLKETPIDIEGGEK